MIFTKELRIDIAQIGVNETIHLHEGDVNGTEFYISLYKNGEPLSLALYNVKYDASIDGYLAEQDANVSLIQGNEIHVPITERMTAKNGILRIDIKLMKNSDIAFIQTVEAFVQRRVINDEVVIDVSGTTIGAKLQELDTEIVHVLESVDGKEDKSNKRQTINPAEAQNNSAIYPSVKAVVDYVANNHQDISGKADKATTLAGYGITDAYIKADVNGLVNDLNTTKANKSEVYTKTQADSLLSGKVSKQTSLPPVATVEQQGQYVVDTTDSSFQNLAITQMFTAEISEVVYTYQKTGTNTYIMLTGLAHTSDIPDVSGKMDLAPSVSPSDIGAVASGQIFFSAGGVAIKTNSGYIELEKARNKVDTIYVSSTNTQYPSAKAVYDYVNGALGTIEAALSEV